MKQKPSSIEQNLFSSNLAEIEVSYTSKVKYKDMQIVKSSKDAEKIFRTIWQPTLEFRESFYILLLNRANKVLGWYRISEGGLSGTVADPRIIFSIALKCNALNIVMAHNHPSGNNQPSAADVQLTKNITEAGRVLEITVLDHLILTKENFYSFVDEGLL
jgi:DNA repair protein RadC